jgi:hypothetical protein
MTTSTPTTKILAIGTINPGVDPAKVFAILPNEVRDTVDLYLNGKIDRGTRSRNVGSARVELRSVSRRLAGGISGYGTLLSALALL